MQTSAFYEEVIEEIGTQTLARCKLNIFSLNTYEAYGASVVMTSNTIKDYNQHKNNPNFHGQTYETLSVGAENIHNAGCNSDKKTYTTDELSNIKHVQDILRSGKKLENLNPKDREKVEYYYNYHKDEVKNLNFTKGDLKELAKTNHPTTDTVTLDKNQKVVNTAQLKAINDTNKLLQDKYLDNNDELRVPSNDYKRHKEQLEKNIEEGRNSDDPEVQEKARKSQKALDKLKADENIDRKESENPRTTAVKIQSIQAITHIGQAGLSDALVAALSTLASGIIWEVKDMCSSQKIDSETSVLDRIKRLIRKVIESFRTNFVRGAGFGGIDAIMGILGQIFTSIAGNLKAIWGKIRASMKSIYNAIHSYITGSIKDTKTLLKTILKGIFSAAWVAPIAALELKLKAILPFGSILAPIFAIVIGAFAVVITARSIDLALDALFASFANVEKSRLRAEDIANLIATRLPILVEKRGALEKLIQKEHKERILSLEASFADYKIAVKNADYNGIYTTLNGINKLFGKELQIKNLEDVKAKLLEPNRTGVLTW